MGVAMAKTHQNVVKGFAHGDRPGVVRHPHGLWGWFGHPQWPKPIKMILEGLLIGWFSHPQWPKPNNFFFLFLSFLCHEMVQPPQIGQGSGSIFN
jgi:hypothetical protein